MSDKKIEQYLQANAVLANIGGEVPENVAEIVRIKNGEVNMETIHEASYEDCPDSDGAVSGGSQEPIGEQLCRLGKFPFNNEPEELDLVSYENKPSSEGNIPENIMKFVTEAIGSVKEEFEYKLEAFKKNLASELSKQVNPTALNEPRKVHTERIIELEKICKDNKERIEKLENVTNKEAQTETIAKGFVKLDKVFAGFEKKAEEKQRKCEIEIETIRKELIQNKIKMEEELNCISTDKVKYEEVIEPLRQDINNFMTQYRSILSKIMEQSEMQRKKLEALIQSKHDVTDYKKLREDFIELMSKVNVVSKEQKSTKETLSKVEGTMKERVSLVENKMLELNQLLNENNQVSKFNFESLMKRVKSMEEDKGLRKESMNVKNLVEKENESNALGTSISNMMDISGMGEEASQSKDELKSILKLSKKHKQKVRLRPESEQASPGKGLQKSNLKSLLSKIK